MDNYRIFVTKTGWSKLQIYKDGKWSFHKSPNGLEVSYSDYRETLKHALGLKYNPADKPPPVYYEDMMLPEEMEDMQKTDIEQMGVNDLYKIAGWINEV